MCLGGLFGKTKRDPFALVTLCVNHVCIGSFIYTPSTPSLAFFSTSCEDLAASTPTWTWALSGSRAASLPKCQRPRPLSTRASWTASTPLSTRSAGWPSVPCKSIGLRILSVGNHVKRHSNLARCLGFFSVMSPFSRQYLYIIHQYIHVVIHNQSMSPIMSSLDLETLKTGNSCPLHCNSMRSSP